MRSLEVGVVPFAKSDEGIAVGAGHGQAGRAREDVHELTELSDERWLAEVIHGIVHHWRRSAILVLESPHDAVRCRNEVGGV